MSRVPPLARLLGVPSSVVPFAVRFVLVWFLEGVLLRVVLRTAGFYWGFLRSLRGRTPTPLVLVTRKGTRKAHCSSQVHFREL